MKNKTSRAIELIETLEAVEVLEYHDKNWLSGDNKTRNEEKRKTLGWIKQILNEEEVKDNGG